MPSESFSNVYLLAGWLAGGEEASTNNTHDGFLNKILDYNIGR